MKLILLVFVQLFGIAFALWPHCDEYGECPVGLICRPDGWCTLAPPPTTTTEKTTPKKSMPDFK
uniref:Uncharacterized protein n=2 Tax=Meloidogyne TaxID=189290 RepID=A0A6V7XU63_MELEN|nr:unnamed protein product [Meloidogyne enterolobii]